jgi:hypothetical protein
MTYVTLSPPGGDADFEVLHFQPAGRFRWNEPPEPGEITLANEGIWTSDDGGQLPVTMEEMVRIYMLAFGLCEADAASKIEDEAYDDVLRQWEEAYDDAAGREP